MKVCQNKNCVEKFSRLIDEHVKNLSWNLEEIISLRTFGFVENTSGLSVRWTPVTRGKLKIYSENTRGEY